MSSVMDETTAIFFEHMFSIVGVVAVFLWGGNGLGLALVLFGWRHELAQERASGDLVD